MFIVKESGRQRVLRTGHKNVHAFVEGALVKPLDSGFEVDNAVRVLYNPHKYSCFTTVEHGPIFRADKVGLYGGLTLASVPQQRGTV